MMKDYKPLRKLNIFFLFLFIFSACGQGPKIPSDFSFMSKKYPEMKILEEKLDSLNRDPENISIESDLVDNKFPSFIQWDERWAMLEYNNALFAKEGQVPTALSSVYTYITKDLNYNPYEMGKFFERRGWNIANMGTSWQAIERGSLELGLSYQVIDRDKIQIDDALDKGKIILASVGQGDFTQDSGLIIIYSHKDDAYRISDPLSIENTNKLWTFTELSWQMIHIWAFDKV